MIAALLVGLIAGFYAGLSQGALSERVRLGRLLASLSREELQRQSQPWPVIVPSTKAPK